MSQPRILITGANGFVGHNLLDHLLATGSADVVAGMRRPDYDGWSARKDMKAVHFDLCDISTMRAVLERHGPTHVINCAAYGICPSDRDPAIAYQTNVQGPLDLLRLCADVGVGRFVQLGTCSEYGNVAGCIKESTPLSPVGTYATTKAAASLLLSETAKLIGVETVVLRLFNIWGKYELPHRLVQQIMNCKKDDVVALSEGSQVRDFSYAKEIAQTIAALTLTDQRLTHEIINIGTGVGISVRDFATKFAQVAGRDRLLDFGAVPIRPDEVRSQIADVTRLRQLTKVLPQPVNHQQINNFVSIS